MTKNINSDKNSGEYILKTKGIHTQEKRHRKLSLHITSIQYTHTLQYFLRF
jgi:hypothetical protein